MNKTESDNLWKALQNSALNFESAITEIIKNKAWEGYSSFYEAWTDKMSNLKIVDSLVKSVVIYQMLEEGVSDVEIALSVSGVGGSTVRKHRANKELGVPVEHGSIGNRRSTVREHARNQKSQPKTVHVSLTPVEYTRLKDYADGFGVQPSEILAAYVRDIILARVK